MDKILLLELRTQALSHEVKTTLYRGLAVGVRFTQEIYAVDLGAVRGDRVIAFDRHRKVYIERYLRYGS